MSVNCRKCQKPCYIRNPSPIGGINDFYCTPCNINQGEEWRNGVKIRFMRCRGICATYLEIKPKRNGELWHYIECSGYCADGRDCRRGNNVGPVSQLGPRCGRQCVLPKDCIKINY
jgi:hypothetical protein